MRLGSGNCELKIPDASVPEIHSQFLLDSSDNLVLVCNNIVYDVLVDGQPYKKLALSNNLVFQVGATTLKVKITNKATGAETKVTVGDGVATKKPTSDKTNNNLPGEATVVAEVMIQAPTKVQKVETSKEKFLTQIKFLLDSAKKEASSTKSFQLFKQPFQLRIVEGPKADDIFIISWGPRDFGPGSAEFPIEFPPYPDILFTLTPNNQGEIFFSTQEPQFAQVNGGQDVYCVIDFGDKIVAGGSTLLVEPLKEN